MTFEVALEANVKLKPLKSDNEAESFKDKTLAFLKGSEQKIRKMYRLHGTLG